MKILRLYFFLLLISVGFNPVFAQEQDSTVVEEINYADLDEPTSDEDSVASTASTKTKEPKQKKEKDPLKQSAFMTTVRSALQYFTLGVSTGYGYTQNSHKLDGFAILQPEEGGVFIYDNTQFGDSTVTAVYDNWLNNPNAITSFDTLNSPIMPGPADFNWNTDSVGVSYRGPSHSIPLIASIHLQFDRYRVGGGFGFEFHRVSNLKPTSLTDTLLTYVPNFRMATYKRYFFYGGYSVYKSKFWEMVADIRVGKVSRGKNYNKDLIKSSWYYNLGFTIEKSLSEYFKVFVRPSIEYKTYSVNIPETGLTINHRQPAVFIGFGATIRMPELTRCPVPGCKVQINHKHENNEYRSKEHPIWKWQDPDYGQNYPVLLKDKKKRKRKGNPY